MDPTKKEVEISKVACLLDELNGAKINKAYWSGYHPIVYKKNVDADALVSLLCSKLQNLDVSQYSLELQTWWRDHKEADRKRLDDEIERQKTNEERANALSKLTPYERKLLGLE